MKTAQRIFVIVQLCFVFSLVCWAVAEPFMDAYFRYKSRLLLYETVTSAKNAERFSALPKEKKRAIEAGYKALQAEQNTPFSTKLKRGFYQLFFGLPLFMRAWLFFSLSICLMLLFRIEGAGLAACILPVVALAYLLDAKKSSPSAVEQLFPSESYLQKLYFVEPLSRNIFTQKKQLEAAWKGYLITEWANKAPSADPQIFASQLAQGEYAFQVAHLETLIASNKKPHAPSASPFLLVLYVLWNGLFALVLNRKTRVKASSCA